MKITTELKGSLSVEEGNAETSRIEQLFGNADAHIGNIISALKLETINLSKRSMDLEQELAESLSASNLLTTQLESSNKEVLRLQSELDKTKELLKKERESKIVYKRAYNVLGEILDKNDIVIDIIGNSVVGYTKKRKPCSSYQELYDDYLIIRTDYY